MNESYTTQSRTHPRIAALYAIACVCARIRTTRLRECDRFMNENALFLFMEYSQWRERNPHHLDGCRRRNKYVCEKNDDNARAAAVVNAACTRTSYEAAHVTRRLCPMRARTYVTGRVGGV